MTAKSKQTKQLQEELPIVRALTLVPGKEVTTCSPYLLYIQGDGVVGCKRLSVDVARWIAINVLRIESSKLFINMDAYSPSPELPSDPVPAETIRALTIVKTKDGRFLPVSLVLEKEKMKTRTALFSGALSMQEAIAVYKGRFEEQFVEQKLIVE